MLTELVNDAGTMKQIALTDLSTNFESALDTKYTKRVTTCGCIKLRRLTSGFGTIDNRLIYISTTTGLITGGSLDIDDVVITVLQ